MYYELEIALRYLRARRRQAFISATTLFTAVGVTVGVGALTITLAVMNGFQESLRQRVLSLTPQVQVTSSAGSITDYPALQMKISRVAGVDGSAPFTIGQAMISSGRAISGVIVRGVQPLNPIAVRSLGRYVTEGDFSTLARAPAPSPGKPPAEGSVALGAVLARKLKVKVGDEVRLVAPIISPGSELTTKTGIFVVGAVVDSGINFIDKEMLLMDFNLAQQFFGRQGRADGIEVHLASLDDTRAVSAALRKLLPQPPYQVRNWQEFNQAAAAGFAMLKKVYALVLVMLIGVAAFNLVATLIMVVMEKRKDIAVLLAMGAKPRQVRLIFVLKGAIVGTAGTLAGLIVGGAGCFALARYRFIHIPREVYGISTVPVAPTVSSFVAVAVASIALCLLATVYPARQASRQLPVEILRS